MNTATTPQRIERGTILAKMGPIKAEEISIMDLGTDIISSVSQAADCLETTNLILGKSVKAAWCSAVYHCGTTQMGKQRDSGLIARSGVIHDAYKELDAAHSCEVSIGIKSDIEINEISIGPTVTEDDTVHIQKIVNEYIDVITLSDEPLGRTTLIE